MSFSCKKDNPQTANPDITTSNSTYFPFIVGNYWYYDLYRVVDTTGLEESLNYSDTTRIIAEEVINSKTYFVIEQDSWLSQDNRKDTLYYRDSSGYIVNVEGNILFSSGDFNNILHETDYAPATWAVEYSVPDLIENHSVPSGDFDCLNFKGRVYSTNPNNNNPDRFLDKCYSENIGIVFQTIFYASQHGVHFERRLSNYHLE
jgi:hypothetical protein